MDTLLIIDFFFFKEAKKKELTSYTNLNSLLVDLVSGTLDFLFIYSYRIVVLRIHKNL
jgi:hypothetical protein